MSFYRPQALIRPGRFPGLAPSFRPTGALLNGTSDFGSTATVPIAAFPYTVAIWGRTTALVGSQMPIGFHNTAGVHHHRMSLTAAGALRISSDAGAGAASSLSTNTLAANTWGHFCGRWTSNTDRKGTLAGNIASQAVNTTSRAFVAGSLNAFSIGRDNDSTPADYWSGPLFWPAIWNVALSDAEVELLAKGECPIFIRPQNLVYFAISLFPKPIMFRGSPYVWTGGASTSLMPPVRWG